MASPQDSLSDKPIKHHRSSELIASAKTVARAAKASFHHENGRVDKGKVAGAAADLLGAVNRHAHLEERTVGRYLKKAEDFLRYYHSSRSTPTSSSTSATAAATPSPTQPNGAAGHSEAMCAENLKMGEGFLQRSDA